MHREPHRAQEAVEMFLAHLDRTEGSVPLAPLALACDRLHILDHDRREWEDLLQLPDDTRLCFPPTPG